MNGKRFEQNELLESLYKEDVDARTDHAISKQIREDYAELNNLILKILCVETQKPAFAIV